MDINLSEFTISRLRLTLAPRETIHLPRLNKGITLRGAFGSTFRSLVCVDRNAPCDGCTVHPLCPYAFIFAPQVPEGAERLRLNRDIPRPFVIKPPLDGREAYEPGEEFSFDLVLVGKAKDFFPYFVVTFRELGERGIGVGRGRFDLKNLEAANTDGTWEHLHGWGELTVRAPSGSISFESFSAVREERLLNRLKIRFLTPVLLKEKGRWARPLSGPLMKRLRDRVSALSYFYCGEVPEMDFRKLGEAAESIRTIQQRLHWVEEKRYSRHRNLSHLLKGFLGEVELEGELGPFMPLLRLGQYLHVGKATAFGQGWYQVEEQGAGTR
ncbi:MAG: CRISPR system precrRNA processing endoribonuclease RAMP protein Cas6 [Syntrophobacteria bacterium]